MKKNHNSENEFAKGPYTYEVCPHCGEEVELRNELMVQTCPHCGKRIVTCSMCRACVECEEHYCVNCCLCYQADKENQEKGRLPVDEIEDILDLFNRSDVEDINFLYHPNKPTIQESGIRYEIVSITPYPDDTQVGLDVIKAQGWAPTTSTWTAPGGGRRFHASSG